MGEGLRRTSSGTRRKGWIVLVVDDSEDTRLTLAMLLASEGLAVLQAGDGLEALKVARVAGPDAILLDQTLPAMSGLDVARKLRAEPRTRRTPIVLLTGRTLGTAHLADVRIDAVLTKPCLPEILLERVREVLEPLERNGRLRQA
jgi:CheY-like chemotaxis protein